MNTEIRTLLVIEYDNVGESLSDELNKELYDLYRYENFHRFVDIKFCTNLKGSDNDIPYRSALIIYEEKVKPL